MTPNDLVELIKKLPKEVGDQPMLIRDSDHLLLEVKTFEVDHAGLVLSLTSSSSTDDSYDYGNGREEA